MNPIRSTGSQQPVQPMELDSSSLDKIIRELQNCTDDPAYKAIITQFLSRHAYLCDELKVPLFSEMLSLLQRTLQLFPNLSCKEEKEIVLEFLYLIPRDAIDGLLASTQQLLQAAPADSVRAYILLMASQLPQDQRATILDRVVQFAGAGPFLLELVVASPEENRLNRLQQLTEILTPLEPTTRHDIAYATQAIVQRTQITEITTEEIIALFKFFISHGNETDLKTLLTAAKSLLPEGRNLKVEYILSTLQLVATFAKNEQEAIIELFKLIDIHNDVKWLGLLQILARCPDYTIRATAIGRVRQSLMGTPSPCEESTLLLKALLPVAAQCDLVQFRIIVDLAKSLSLAQVAHFIARFSRWLSQMDGRNCTFMFRAMASSGILPSMRDPLLDRIQRFLQAHPERLNEIADEFVIPAQLRLTAKYRLILAREELKTHPEVLLNTLCGLFKGLSASQLHIEFANEPAVDEQGPSRDFITTLFEGIRNKMPFKLLDNGLARPSLRFTGSQFQPLCPHEKKVYHQLGQLMMFCLNAPRHPYPIGRLFDPGVFKVLPHLLPEYLERDTEELARDENKFCQLFELYAKMHGENQMIVQMRSCLHEIREEVVQMHLRPTLVPLCELARGMRDAPAPMQMNLSWHDLQHTSPDLISEWLQGTISPQKIVNTIVFDARLSEVQKSWIKNWILSLDKPKMEKFLFALTGAKALGPNPLHIVKGYGIPTCRTCTQTLELPSSDTEAATVGSLERAIEGPEIFNIV